MKIIITNKVKALQRKYNLLESFITQAKPDETVKIKFNKYNKEIILKYNDTITIDGANCYINNKCFNLSKLNIDSIFIAKKYI